MVTTSTVVRTKKWLINFIDLQLFLTCVSLPILIGWGMPLSAASIVGNLIFMPFLTLFLLFASLIFFCELLHIPQDALIFLLEKISSAWLFCMHYGQREWLFGFPTLPVALLLIILIIPFIIICLRFSVDQNRRIGLFLLFISIIYLISHIGTISKDHKFDIKSGHGAWHCLRKHNQLVIIDDRASSGIKSMSSIIDYTLLPELIKATGSRTIDHLIITAPGQTTFATLSYLLEKTTVKHIYIAWWQGSPNKKFWREFFTLKEKVQQTECQWHTIYKKPVIIALESHECVEICADKTIENKAKNIAYPTLKISHIIDNQANTLYAA